MDTHILPLGFIDRPTGDGAVITLTNPRDSRTLKPGVPVVIWRYSPGRLALAKVRGEISEVGFVTARFATVETRVDARWPEWQEIIQPAMPVYLAEKGSFEPDTSRMLTPTEAESIGRIAEVYGRLTKPEKANRPDGGSRKKNGQTPNH